MNKFIKQKKEEDVSAQTRIQRSHFIQKLSGYMHNIIESRFFTRPLLIEHNYSESHLDKGAGYDRRFSELPGRKLMWNLEKKILRNEVAKVDDYLDFATGTGRIICELSDLANKKYGLDISRKMLEVATKNCKEAIFVEGDFRRRMPEFEDKQFDLITAFRFFSGAERQLRENAMGFISDKLKQNGILIANNHRNFWSIIYILMRGFGIKRGFGGMTSGEMIHLAEKHGLKLVRSYSVGLLAYTEKKGILPWSIISYIENKLLFFSRFHKLGYNVIFVFRKEEIRKT